MLTITVLFLYEHLFHLFLALQRVIIVDKEIAVTHMTGIEGLLGCVNDILYGNRTKAQILYKEEFDKLSQDERVTIAHVFSGEDKESYAAQHNHVLRTLPYLLEVQQIRVNSLVNGNLSVKGGWTDLR